jgi:hypothetical protein
VVDNETTQADAVKAYTPPPSPAPASSPRPPCRCRAGPDCFGLDPLRTGFRQPERLQHDRQQALHHSFSARQECRASLARCRPCYCRSWEPPHSCGGW